MPTVYLSSLNDDDNNVNYKFKDSEVREEVTDLKSALNDDENDLFVDSQINPFTSVNGWRLNETNGLSAKNSLYALLEYTVTAGERLNIVSDDRFQFQSATNVPSSGASNRVGQTYQDGSFKVVAPDGATCLVVSTLANESTASVYRVVPKLEVEKKRINALEQQQAFTYSDYGLDYTILSYGYTFTKNGPIVEIDGARTGSTYYGTSLTTDVLSSVRTSFEQESYVNPKLKLKAGRTYLVRIKFISGSLTDTNVGRKHGFYLDTYNGETVSSILLKEISLASKETIDAFDIPVSETIITPDEDIQCGLVWYCRGYLELNKFTIMFDIEDISNYELFAETNAHDIVTENKEAVTRIQASNWWWGAKAEKPSMLNLLHFSDIHGWREELERIVEMKQYLKENGMLSNAICTGDLVTASYGGGDYENVWLKTAGTSDILFAVGNHDTYRQTKSPHGTLTAAEKYAAFFDGHTSEWGITMQPDVSYYYKDYVESGIRLIVADTAVGDSDPNQKAWLDATLEDARTNGYSVILAAHYLRLNSTTEIKSATIIDNQWSNTRARAAGTDEMGYDWSGTDIVKCVTDFIAAGGSFVCYLIGHTHSDIVGYPTGHPEQLIITVCAAGVGEATAANRANTCGDLPRKTGTKTEDCFNLVTINPTTKVLYCVRVGSDINMLQIPRKAFSWDYSSHKFIHVM